jgi:hypothetical protein
MARHIEQPGSRQSKPAAVNTASRPSDSAWALTRWEPGTTRARMPVGPATPQHVGGGPQVLDAAVGARADEDGVDGDVAHRRAGQQVHVGEGPVGGVLSAASSNDPGSGTVPSIRTTWAGLVPQVT